MPSPSEPSNGLWRQILNVRRDEWPQALLMFGYFFLVITTFWILKPLKKTEFVRFYDVDGFDLLGWAMTAAQAEQLAKVTNMLVAVVAAAAFAALSRRFRREKLTHVFCGFLLACFAGYWIWFQYPGAGTVWSFYFFGDLYNTLMVASFFAFLNDSVDSNGAKRLYGVIGLGGVAGGAFGTTILSAYIDQLSLSAWMWVCALFTLAVMALAAAAGARFRAAGALPDATASEEKPSKGNAALEGARLVFRSRYLLALVLMVGLYEMVSTVMDFQFTSTVAHYLDGDALAAHFALVYAITNWLALTVQLFLTSFVMSRFGVGVALLFLPCAALLGSTGFLIAPILLTASSLTVADNAFNYSINQSAREALYVPTTREEKYQAKAFIDMFVQRFAKALAVGLSLALTATASGIGGIRWLSLLTLVLLALWIRTAWYAGRAFEDRTAEDETETQPKAEPQSATA